MDDYDGNDDDDHHHHHHRYCYDDGDDDGDLPNPAGRYSPHLIPT